VNAKTEQFLNLLLWSAEQVMRPTFRNLTESYEGWAYRSGLLKQVHRLERQRWLDSKAGASNDRLYRLTAEARLHVLGGRDPEQRWARYWDGQWRMVLFDVPVEHNSHRRRLWRYLRNNGFGFLQNSVWITPDPLEQERQILASGNVDVESLILLEARPCAGESDQEVVSGAWNFEQINQRYAEYLEVLKQRPTGSLRTPARAKGLQKWAVSEREAWLNAVTKDPLLPERILPHDYLGRRAWERRKQVLQQAGKQLRTFRYTAGHDTVGSHT
jgi:phenylacetic acid degradation operon negative regulatory protein